MTQYLNDRPNSAEKKKVLGANAPEKEGGGATKWRWSENIPNLLGAAFLECLGLKKRENQHEKMWGECEWNHV